MGEYLEVINSNRTNVIIETSHTPSGLMNPSDSGNQKWIADAVKWSGLSGLTSNDFDAVMGIAVRYLFKFDNEVFEALQTARSTLGLTGPYTALHVRTGFTGTASGELARFLNKFKMPQSPLEWPPIFHCAISVTDRAMGKSSPIYLATDSSRVKEMAIRMYPQRFRTLSNAVVHVDKLPHWKKAGDLLELNTKEKEGLLVVWIELFLLAQANTLMRGLSGFSRLAGFLCGLNGSMITIITDCV